MPTYTSTQNIFTPQQEYLKKFFLDGLNQYNKFMIVDNAYERYKDNDIIFDARHNMLCSSGVAPNEALSEKMRSSLGEAADGKLSYWQCTQDKILFLVEMLRLQECQPSSPWSNNNNRSIFLHFTVRHESQRPYIEIAINHETENNIAHLFQRYKPTPADSRGFSQYDKILDMNYPYFKNRGMLTSNIDPQKTDFWIFSTDNGELAERYSKDRFLWFKHCSIVAFPFTRSLKKLITLDSNEESFSLVLSFTETKDKWQKVQGKDFPVDQALYLTAFFTSPDQTDTFDNLDELYSPPLTLREYMKITGAEPQSYLQYFTNRSGSYLYLDLIMKFLREEKVTISKMNQISRLTNYYLPIPAALAVWGLAWYSLGHTTTTNPYFLLRLLTTPSLLSGVPKTMAQTFVAALIIGVGIQLYVNSVTFQEKRRINQLPITEGMLQGITSGAQRELTPSHMNNNFSSTVANQGAIIQEWSTHIARRQRK